MAISGRHGNTSALKGVKSGVGIIMTRLNDLHLSDEGNTVVAGGGLLSGEFLKRLWEMGKVTGTVPFQRSEQDTEAFDGG